MYCVKCGSKLSDQGLFCPKCGAKIQEISEQVYNKDSMNVDNDIEFNTKEDDENAIKQLEYIESIQMVEDITDVEEIEINDEIDTRDVDLDKDDSNVVINDLNNKNDNIKDVKYEDSSNEQQNCQEKPNDEIKETIINEETTEEQLKKQVEDLKEVNDTLAKDLIMKKFIMFLAALALVLIIISTSANKIFGVTNNKKIIEKAKNVEYIEYASLPQQFKGEKLKETGIVLSAFPDKEDPDRTIILMSLLTENYEYMFQPICVETYITEAKKLTGGENITVGGYVEIDRKYGYDDYDGNRVHIPILTAKGLIIN